MFPVRRYQYKGNTNNYGSKMKNTIISKKRLITVFSVTLVLVLLIACTSFPGGTRIYNDKEIAIDKIVATAAPVTPISRL